MNGTVKTCDDLLAELRTFKKLHGDEYGLKSLGVFGSFARGEATDDSDIDIVFETNQPNLFRSSRMRQKLEELLAHHVDVVRLRGNMNPRLKKRILQEARYV